MMPQRASWRRILSMSVCMSRPPVNDRAAGRGAISAPGPRSTRALELWRPPAAARARETCGGRRDGAPSRPARRGRTRHARTSTAAAAASRLVARLADGARDAGRRGERRGASGGGAQHLVDRVDAHQLERETMDGAAAFERRDGGDTAADRASVPHLRAQVVRERVQYPPRAEELEVPPAEPRLRDAAARREVEAPAASVE